MPQEYADFLLMTQLWHCPPTIFDQQPEELVDLHLGIYALELKADAKRARREDQLRKITK